MHLVKSVIVLGGGTAGFLAAIALRAKNPDISLRLIRSKDIGIIGVGEGTNAFVPKALHDFMGLDVAEFYREAQPIWKLGIKYLWGPRDQFYYPFSPQMTATHPQLPLNLGYYAGEDIAYISMPGALMRHDRAFARDPKTGLPFISRSHSYHLENKIFVAYLEKAAMARGTTIIDDTVSSVEVDEAGVKSLHLASGRTETADLYVDASGFMSELLGKALGEPHVSFASSLFCDRACVGGWKREPTEVIQPYTVAETMNAGWCWRIDHEHQINRGYVYSSSFITDETAEREFREKNPKVQQTRIVKFFSGRRERAWVKNVCAIGNAYGFVEPLEATAIAAICEGVINLSYALSTNRGYIGETLRTKFNQYNQRNWDTIRRFLAVHYKYNTRLNTPFWQAAREKIDLAGAEDLCDFYRENGPNLLWKQLLLDPIDQFGMEGYLSMLVGQNAPYSPRYEPSQAEMQIYQHICAENRRQAESGYTVAAALELVRHPQWQWTPGFFRG